MCRRAFRASTDVLGGCVGHVQGLLLDLAALGFGGQLFAGAVLVETVYAWPGMGRLVYESILRRDYPTLLGVLFFSAVLVMVVNILTDLVYRLIDPRIRTGG